MMKHRKALIALYLTAAGVSALALPMTKPWSALGQAKTLSGYDGS
jgi:hypothetical protein